MTNILKSIRGRELGLSSMGRLICPGGYVSGRHGKQIWQPSAEKAAIFEDFGTLLIPATLAFTEGTDSSTSDGAIVSGAENGVYRLTAGDSAGTVAADQAQIAGALRWKASTGGLVFAARVALGAITTVTCFVGLTDSTSLETPIESAASADTITTNATDAVGFMFDTRMATDRWWLVGVANDVDASKQDAGIAPVASTYEWLQIEIDSSGNASFYRNGSPLGSVMTGAVTPSVALCPIICIRPEGAVAGRTIDIDVLHVAANRT